MVGFVFVLAPLLVIVFLFVELFEDSFVVLTLGVYSSHQYKRPTWRAQLRQWPVRVQSVLWAVPYQINTIKLNQCAVKKRLPFPRSDIQLAKE